VIRFPCEELRGVEKDRADHGSHGLFFFKANRRTSTAHSDIVAGAGIDRQPECGHE
jgi:hypothetical protein